MKRFFAVLLAASTAAIAPIANGAGDASAKAGAVAAEVAGTWDFVVSSDQGTGTPVFTFTQDGSKLSGTYKGQFGEAPVTGTVQGNSVTFSVTINAGEEVKVEYAGTVQGASMKGTTKFGVEGEGTFTAKKRAGK